MQIDSKSSSPPLQMLLQYHTLKHGLFITALVSILTALFIFFTYPLEERFFRSALGFFLGCYFFSLYHFAFRRVSSIRGMDLLTACFLLVPTITHACSIIRYPEEDFAGVLVLALLILASISFVSHLNFLIFVFSIAGFLAFSFFSAGANLQIGFWLNTLFVAPAVAFLVRVVVQKNYSLLLERLNYEQQLSAKLASTADALRISQKDQEQSQIDLEQLDLQLSSLLSNAPIVLSVMDRDGVYTQSRGRGLKQIGLAENEIVGRPCEEIYKDQPEVLAAFKKAQQGESSQVRASFAGLTHEIQYCPVFGEAQEVIGVVGVGLDVSESVLIERQKQELESQILQSQKMESLGSLASGVAHDFNNYLGAIIAFCELWQQQPRGVGALSIDPREIPVEIKKIASNASGVCEQMLMFAGKTTNEKIDVDLSSLVSEMEQFFRAIISKEIELDIELAQYPISINANRLSIQQSIVNLLKNASEAIKGRPKGERGRILISTHILDGISPVSPRGVRIGELGSQQEQGSFAVLTIEDNGGGIEPADLQRVFEPYFSVKPNGHGFGLAITAGVVKNHNGVIYCDSNSSGTRIDLAFPVSEFKDAAVPQDCRTRYSTSDVAERILLVDDEAMITKSIGSVLEALGYDMTTANSGAATLGLIDSGEEFDCIITDFSMPGMNGLELMDELKDRQISTPVIMCSGYFELPETGENLPQATLRKPYSIDELKETIGQVCAAVPDGLVK